MPYLRNSCVSVLLLVQVVVRECRRLHRQSTGRASSGITCSHHLWQLGRHTSSTTRRFPLPAFTARRPSVVWRYTTSRSQSVGSVLPRYAIQQYSVQLAARSFMYEAAAVRIRPRLGVQCSLLVKKTHNKRIARKNKDNVNEKSNKAKNGQGMMISVVVTS